LSYEEIEKVQKMFTPKILKLKTKIFTDQECCLFLISNSSYAEAQFQLILSLLGQRHSSYAEAQFQLSCGEQR